MTSLLKLRINGLESHTELLEDSSVVKDITKLLTYEEPEEIPEEIVAGLEAFHYAENRFTDTKDLGDAIQGAAKLTKAVGGELLKLGGKAAKFNVKKAEEAFDKLKIQIPKAIKDNKSYLAELLKQYPEDKPLTIRFSDLDKLTSDGKVTSFVSDVKEYIDFMAVVNKHADAELDYFKSVTAALKKISKDTDDSKASDVISSLEGLKPPQLKLDKTSDGETTSNPLIGGKVYVCKYGDVNKYSIRTDRPLNKPVDVSYTQAQAKEILNALANLNESMMVISKKQEAYIQAIKDSAKSGAKLEEALTVNSKLSSHVVKDLKSASALTKSTAAFYGELYPAILGNVNSHILTLAGKFAKNI